MELLKPSTLFKVHENQECEELLNLTRYLYSEGFDVTPANIQERNFPREVRTVPTAVFNSGFILIGYQNFVLYYEQLLGVKDLDSKVKKFTKNNKEYRISDKSTHKKLVRVPLL